MRPYYSRCEPMAQNILIADNNVGAVAVANKVFVGATALQDAVAFASDDDIIQVIRSSVNYGTITIDKRLNIFGIGLNPDTEGGSLSPVTQIDITETDRNRNQDLGSQHRHGSQPWRRSCWCFG